MFDAIADFLFGPAPIVWVQDLFSTAWTMPFLIVDLLGISWGMILVLGLAFWLWGREDAYAVAGILLFEGATNLVLNQFSFIARPSAPQIRVHQEISLPSFPSGHVYTTVVLWGLLYARGRVPLLLTATAIFLVGLGRLFLGAHYLGDVLGGILIGVLVLWAFVHLWPRIRGWLGRRSSGFFVGLAALAVVGSAVLIMLLAGSPFVWNTQAVAAGAAIGLLIESRYVGYAPGPLTAGEQARRVLIGLAGIVPFALIDRLTGEQPLALGAAAAFLAALWATLAAPALFEDQSPPPI